MTPQWVWQMHREFFRYAVPLTFGPPPRRHETAELHVGTCVGIQFGDAQFLITAGHVMAPALEAVTRTGADCLAGNVKIDVTPETVAFSEKALDVATVRLSAATVAAFERDGYLIMRPPEWPPAALAISDPILAAGFLGAWRRQVSWDAMDLLGTTKLGLIHHLRETEFVCQLDPAFVDQYTAEHGEVSEQDLPGMSGGPAILVRQDRVLVPRLCGIVKQGVAFEGGNRLLYFAKLDRVGVDGTF